MSNQIYALIPQAMQLVGSIGKDRNNAGQGYKFRGIDDVYNAVNPVFAKLGIFVVPRVIAQVREERQGKSGGALLYTILTVEHEFYAPDGSSVKAVTVGEAMDSGDKSANKAMSAAMKYAVIEVLSIPTEEDNDTENHSPEPRPAAPPPRQASNYPVSPVSSPPPSKPSSASGAVFPPYGRAKGEPVSGGTVGNLEFYRSGCLRNLDDQSKARWHDKERALLAAIDAELIRRGAMPPDLDNGRTQEEVEDGVPF